MVYSAFIMRILIKLLSITLFLTLFLYSNPVYSNEKSITIAAAADTAFALNEIAQGFEKETGIKVILTFGSTGMLFHQIENGAPFHAFFSANKSYIDRLMEKGLVIPETQVVYAQGRIVLAVNKNYGVNAKKLEDLLNPEIKKVAIANPAHAPYGIAAKEALIKFNLWDKLKPKLVYTDNVRQALQFVQTNNADAGIIALSIAGLPQISYTIIDDNLHEPLIQSAAVIKGAGLEKEAREFLKYAAGAQGKIILKKYGFIVP